MVSSNHVTALLCFKNKYLMYNVLDNVHVDKKVSSNGNVPGLKKGDSVYITTFINVHNCYVRKVEDETDEFTDFIETVNSYCSSGDYYFYFSIHKI